MQSGSAWVWLVRYAVNPGACTRTRRSTEEGFCLITAGRATNYWARCTQSFAGKQNPESPARTTRKGARRESLETPRSDRECDAVPRGGGVNVLAVQLDGQLPNLALMKIAHWHLSQGD